MGAYLVTVSQFGANRYEEALPLYERAVEICAMADTHNNESNMLKAKNGLAHVLFRTGRVEDAIALMNQVEAECASSTTLVERDEVCCALSVCIGVELCSCIVLSAQYIVWHWVSCDRGCVCTPKEWVYLALFDGSVSGLRA